MSNADNKKNIKIENIRVGIDVIAFSTSRYFLPLKTLAEHRDVDYRKYYEGIGQKQMSVFPPNEDIVTISIDAARKVLSKIDNKDKIDLLIFATESSFDLSKSAGIYVHHFLKLKSNCRVFDMKQACYSATAALQMAKNFVENNPNSKALVIGSDIVKYSPNTSGEPTQGGAAVAMLISKKPRLAYIEPFSGVYTTDVADFWRPAAATEAMFDGRLSAHNYLRSLEYVFGIYLQQNKLSLDNIDYTCFHAPFNKMAIKAARQFFPGKDIKDILIYNALIGNSCSASLYISLISLIDNCKQNLSGKRIGMYSYGSGSVAEYYSLVMSDQYKTTVFSEENRINITNRIEVSFDEYEKLCSNDTVSDYTHEKGPYETIGSVSLAGIKDGYRVYEDRYGYCEAFL